jgi:methionyl aminopeptidase
LLFFLNYLLKMNHSMIKSAFIHKKIVKKIFNHINENTNIYDLAKNIESMIQEECKGELNNGIAFPVGICINHCVAHYTPFPNDPNMILQNGDLVKIDFGVHIHGEITDSAFTICINNQKLNDLISISKRATMIGVEMSKVDILLSEIGEAIEEYVLSKEIEVDGKIYPLKTFSELCGHSISPYIIHSGKAVPNCKLNFPYTLRMNIGEKYAIEPFVTTGNGVCIYKKPNNHFMLSRNHCQEYEKNKVFLLPEDSNIYNYIHRYYKSLPFSNRWMLEESVKNYDTGLEKLVKYKIVDEFLPIYDVEGSYVAHHEHNVFIGEKKSIHLTKNEFY